MRQFKRPNSGTKYTRPGYDYQLQDKYEYMFKKIVKPEWNPQTRLEKCKCCENTGCIYHNAYFCVTENRLIVCKGYSWDGPSGPVIRTRNGMRASLVHDALYQAFRERGLKLTHFSRRWADNEFRRILKEDGMKWWRRRIWYWGVRLFGKESARP